MSFENAPVTKGLMVSLALSSIIVGLFDIKHYFHLQLVPHMSRHHQYWRLISNHLAFSNSSDLFLVELLFYNVGIQIERQFGSLKFASFTFVSTIITTLLGFIALLLFHRVGLNHIALGPSALTFSLLYQYSRIVPAAYSYRVFGVPLNNKSFYYVLGLQIAISRPPSSIAVAVIGIMSGQIYRSDIAGLNTYRLPSSVVRFSTRFLSPVIGALRPPRRSNNALPEEFRSNVGSQNDEVVTTARRLNPPSITQPAEPSAPSVMREWVDELTGRTDRASAGLRAPTDAEITHLTTMFPSIERGAVIGALQRSHNIEGAVETLLQTQT